MKSLQRKLKAKLSGDPEGVLAALQVTKRLVKEGNSLLDAMDKACFEMSAAKDPARVWWAVSHVIAAHIDDSEASWWVTLNRQMLLDTLDRAILHQGQLNAAAAKAKLKAETTTKGREARK